MPFEPPYITCRVNGDRAALLEPLVYVGREDTFTVPAGFVTDFATVPRLVTWLVPRMGTHTQAAVLHDWLCTEGIEQGWVSSVDADGIFRRVMREDGVGFARRWVAWTGVRWGALVTPRRRARWWRTLPQVAAGSVAVAAPVVVVWRLVRRS